MTTATASPSGGLQRWEQWLGLSEEEAIDPGLPIVDPHHHLWDRGGHTYLPAQFLADARGHKLDATMYVECLSQYRTTGPEHLRPVGEIEYVMTLLARPGEGQTSGLCAGIIARADLSLGDAVEEVLDAHALAARGRFKGVRYVSAWDADPAIHKSYPTHAGMLREAAVQLGARALARKGLVFDAWLYFHQLDDVALLAKACPDLQIVVNHCGGPVGIGPYAGHREQVFSQWQNALRAMRPLDNVSIKFGGLAMAPAGFPWRSLPAPPSSDELVRAWQPYFDVCLETFGAGRCMFESNFPLDRTGCSYTSLWNAFKRLAEPLSDPERSALCADTARRVYRL